MSFKQEETMTSKATDKITCLIPDGMRIVNAALITKEANCSNSHVTVECNSRIASAHKILEILSAGIAYGSLVLITAIGEDAEETLARISMLLQAQIEEDTPSIHNNKLQTAFT